LFWSSGILKETFVILGISLFINALFYQINYSNKITFSLISFVILFLFKPYILICIIISSIFYCIYILKKTKSILYSTLSFIILFTLVLSNSSIRNKITSNITIKQNHSKNIAIPGLHVRGDTCLYYFEKKDYNKLRFYNDTLIEVKTKTKALYRARKDKYPSRIIEISPSNEVLKIRLNTHGANSFFRTTPINNQFSQLIKNLPEGLSNSFFRPFPNENGGIMKFISIIDIIITFCSLNCTTVCFCFEYLQ
jgi:FlaA1/EpsC-like NDP-sugar epimerase